VEEKCTCGAVTVEGARFCHRCGRPLRDEPQAADEEPVTGTDLAPREDEPEAGQPLPAELVRARALSQEIPPTEISFKNGQAVRVALLTSMFILVALMATFPFGGQIAGLLVALGGGFYAVFLYRRRSGAGLSVVGGARMGWMTGVFTFVLITVLFTVSMALLSGNEEFLRAYEQNARNMGLSPENSQRVVDLIRNPVVIFVALGMQFLMLTLVCSLGGALGAKLIQRQD